MAYSLNSPLICFSLLWPQIISERLPYRRVVRISSSILYGSDDMPTPLFTFSSDWLFTRSWKNIMVSTYSFRVFSRLSFIFFHFIAGCVNCLNFNSSGDLICSGSDDLQIAIWDWQRNQLRHKYHSGHSQNVFNCKFCVDGNHIVSCSRDGQVRICDVRNTTLTLSRKLAQHKGSAHKLALISPQVILSSGEDAIVHEMDLRADKPTKVLLVKEGSKRMPLYSIHNCMTMNPFQFVVSGRSPVVHVYDRRYLTTASDSPAPLEKLCPPHLKDSTHTVTCAVYDSVGRSVLATYNDDDIYLFDSRSGELEHSYKGHRNSATIKGVSWFTDDFVISGSDDGYVYGWDRESEHIVMSLYADANGVVSFFFRILFFASKEWIDSTTFQVNCMETHPNCPYLATSGKCLLIFFAYLLIILFSDHRSGWQHKSEIVLRFEFILNETFCFLVPGLDSIRWAVASNNERH